MIKEKEDEIEKKDVELSDAKKELEDTKKTNIELSEKVTLSEKEASFKVLLSEGKVTPSQKDAFLKMDIKLSEEFFGKADVKINLTEAGHGKNTSVNNKETEETEMSASDVVTKMALELSEKDTIDFGSAVSIVLSENSELNEKYINETKE